MISILASGHPPWFTVELILVTITGTAIATAATYFYRLFRRLDHHLKATTDNNAELPAQQNAQSDEQSAALKEIVNRLAHVEEVTVESREELRNIRIKVTEINGTVKRNSDDIKEHDAKLDDRADHTTRIRAIEHHIHRT